MRQVVSPHADSQSDLWIFSQMAKRFEHGKKLKFPEEPATVFDEMRYLSKGRLVDISGMTHDKIEQQRGIQWPYPADKAADTELANYSLTRGAQRLYEDGIYQHADGKAKLIPLPFIDNNEVPDDEYPLWLNTGRVVEHFHTRTKTGKIGNCNKYSPTPYMEMNPDAAMELGVAHMSYVRVVSRRGDAVVLVQLTQRVPHNMIFIPFHYHDCVNRLCLGLLDPHSRQPAYKQSAVRIEHVDQKEAAQLNVEMRNF